VKCNGSPNKDGDENIGCNIVTWAVLVWSSLLEIRVSLTMNLTVGKWNNSLDVSALIRKSIIDHNIN